MAPTHRKIGSQPPPFAPSAPTLHPANSNVPTPDQMKPTKTTLPFSQKPLKPGETQGRTGSKNTNKSRTQKIHSDQTNQTRTNPRPPPPPTSRPQPPSQSPQTPKRRRHLTRSRPQPRRPPPAGAKPHPADKQTCQHQDRINQPKNEPLVFPKNPLKLWVGGRGGGRAPQKFKKTLRTRKKCLANNPNQGPRNRPAGFYPRHCAVP